MEWINPTREDVIKELKILLDDGENKEYVRGALEIVCSFMNPQEDMSHGEIVVELAKEIGLPTETINKL